ncbi:MAG: response regulator [Cyclobacteriaceae bacterium]|nr:response regulator [Cyclobacteriaceae bacterium]MDH4296460.1 response regulator [Cyclobacteriaceae bacterium]MDH5250097.1 response regulator [Cyclobacteriaceae bacterium]
MRVLIVDDEELDLFIHKKLLSLEFETAGFTSVKDALAWAAQNDFDVAIIDYYLGTGIYANHMLKELIAIRGATFKAFVATNYVNDKQVIDLRASGFTDIIYKPLTLEILNSKLGL